MKREENRPAAYGIGRQRSLVERYVRHQLSVHAHAYELRAGDIGPAGDYCVSFESPGDGFELSKLEGHVAADLEVPQLEGGIDERKEAVLVGVREFLKLPQRARSGVLPAVVRLQSLDDCRGGGGHTDDLVESAVRSGLAPLRPFGAELSELPAAEVDREGRRLDEFRGTRPDLFPSISWKARWSRAERRLWTQSPMSSPQSGPGSLMSSTRKTGRRCLFTSRAMS
jgi:hypothetical protein